MEVTQALLDDLTARAKASPRLRMNLDLRNSAEDHSQRMLNAIEPGSPLPVHRHRKSSETVVCLRGRLRELFYNDAGEVTEVIDLAPGSDCVALNIPLGQWHTVEVLESGNFGQGRDRSYKEKYPAVIAYIISAWIYTRYNLLQFSIFPSDALKGWTSTMKKGLKAVRGRKRE